MQGALGQCSNRRGSPINAGVLRSVFKRLLEVLRYSTWGVQQWRPQTMMATWRTMTATTATSTKMMATNNYGHKQSIVMISLTALLSLSVLWPSLSTLLRHWRGLWPSFFGCHCCGRHCIGCIRGTGRNSELRGVTCHMELPATRHQWTYIMWLGVLMNDQAPRCLTNHCTPISDTVFRQRLRLASSHINSLLSMSVSEVNLYSTFS